MRTIHVATSITLVEGDKPKKTKSWIGSIDADEKATDDEIFALAASEVASVQLGKICKKLPE